MHDGISWWVLHDPREQRFWSFLHLALYLSVYKYVCLYLYASYAGIYVSVLVLCSSYYHLFMLLSCFVLCRSDLKRLNFWGFYTIVLERGDELISVATFRYYSDCFITKSFPMRFVCPIFFSLVTFLNYY